MNTVKPRAFRLICGLIGFAFVFPLLFFSDVEGQTTDIDQRVEGGRPVAEAIRLLTSRYPIIITYEDPRYEYPGDMMDVTETVRRDLHLHPPARAPRVLVPRAANLEFSYTVSNETGAPQDWGVAVASILNAHAANVGGGRFRIEQTGEVLHVVPIATRDTRGQWTAQASILDALIVIPNQELNGIQMLEAICAAVTAATGHTLSVGTIPLNSFLRYEGTLEASGGERARDVLLRTLRAVDGRLTWRILYGPDTRFYALNIGTVAAPPAQAGDLPQLPADPGSSAVQPSPVGQP